MNDLGFILVYDFTDLAAIVAALVREGVTFEARPTTGGAYKIVLTGGY